MSPYDFAIQMSRDGEKFFRTLATQVKKPGLHKILVMLANDQAIHFGGRHSAAHGRGCEAALGIPQRR